MSPILIIFINNDNEIQMGAKIGLAYLETMAKLSLLDLFSSFPVVKINASVKWTCPESV